MFFLHIEDAAPAKVHSVTQQQLMYCLRRDGGVDLVLIKLPMLFEREAQARREDQVDLRWIRERLNRIGQDT